ncbi:MAG TPA: LON peptidase substrate-binding domain-containing protein [Candidatus Binataceae bacterium]|jgi:Lon protease-like protein|nr:LON peptidase substrate-binding domain-containing protein [Candidatus Binataceae bacterium]
MAELPDIIPIFPLPNFVLFPGVTVPLHIFEPRYREMVADVAENHGTVGMIMLKGDWEREYYAYPDIFSIGCAGRITSLEKLPDGRYNLQLEGISEFQVGREIRSHSYRQAEVQWCPSGRRLLGLEPSEMNSLHDLLVGFLGENADAAWRGLVDEQGLRDADLINFLCFHLDVTPLEKQTLLEALDDRIACLFDVLTFKIEERKLGPSGPRGGGTVN